MIDLIKNLIREDIYNVITPVLWLIPFLYFQKIKSKIAWSGNGRQYFLESLILRVLSR